MIGGSVPPADGWALVITGGGSAPSTTFEFTLGGKPNIGGPVYVHDVNRTSFAQETTIVEGDLWYQDAGCAGSGSGTTFRRSNIPIANLTFDPTTRGAYCTNSSWSGLFGSAPPVADLGSLPLNPPYENVGSCRVFEPGVYTTLSASDLASNNYFRSGNYLFRDLGQLTIQGKAVTMGHIVNFEGFPATDNSRCDNYRLNDEASGATLYLDGTTSIRMASNSSFEVSRRQQGQFQVGVHVLGGSPAGSEGSIMSAAPGARKELAIQGLTWAPSSRLVFETVPAQKAAVLRGGAVLGSFKGGISAAAIGFVIEIPTEQASTTLMLESSATDGRTTTRIRVIAEYRPSNGETAVNSWRVVEGLPDPS